MIKRKRYNKKEREQMFYARLRDIDSELKAIRIHLMPESKNSNFVVAKSGRLMVRPISENDEDLVIYDNY